MENSALWSALWSQLKREFATATTASLVLNFKPWRADFQHGKSQKSHRVRWSGWPWSQALWETLPSYWKYVDTCHCARGCISSSIPVFFFSDVCEQSFQNLTIILRIDNLFLSLTSGWDHTLINDSAFVKKNWVVLCQCTLPLVLTWNTCVNKSRMCFEHT